VDTAAGESTTTSHPTLAESAALQQARQSHVELKEVEVVTGEEDESNVFQVTSLPVPWTISVDLLRRLVAVECLLSLVVYCGCENSCCLCYKLARNIQYCVECI